MRRGVAFCFAVSVGLAAVSLLLEPSSRVALYFDYVSVAVAAAALLLYWTRRRP